jgi:hypothetical protein
MSRTFKSYPSWHRSARSSCQPGPSTSYRRMWRRQARVRQKNAFTESRDLSEVQIETKIQKLTSIYDWY